MRVKRRQPAFRVWCKAVCGLSPGAKASERSERRMVYELQSRSARYGRFMWSTQFPPFALYRRFNTFILVLFPIRSIGIIHDIGIETPAGARPKVGGKPSTAIMKAAMSSRSDLPGNSSEGPLLTEFLVCAIPKMVPTEVGQ